MITLRQRSQQLIEYYDSARRPHPLVEEALALIHYRELIVQFVQRSIKIRYKRSVLGVVWTLLNPLLTMLVLTIVFSQVFRFDIENFPVYVLSGLVAWNFYSSTTAGAMNDMLWSGSLLGRIYIPKSIFAVAALGTGLVNFFLSLIPLFVITLVVERGISPTVLVMPFAILIMAAFTLGISLLLSTAAIFFADMLSVYSVVLTIWMYATPIIYPLEVVPPQFQWVMKLNPLYYMVELFRQPLYSGTIPELSVWLIAAAFALVAILLGGFIFTWRSNEYAYRL
jgi:ABC-2 type transport system permease protein